MNVNVFFFSHLVRIEQRKASKAPKNRLSKKCKENTFFRCSASLHFGSSLRRRKSTFSKVCIFSFLKKLVFRILVTKMKEAQGEEDQSGERLSMKSLGGEHLLMCSTVLSRRSQGWAASSIQPGCLNFSSYTSTQCL